MHFRVEVWHRSGDGSRRQLRVAGEADVEEAYPVFHHEMGPVWTGTLQAVFA